MQQPSHRGGGGRRGRYGRRGGGRGPYGRSTGGNATPHSGAPKTAAEGSGDSTVRISVNHFKVNYDMEKSIMHYHVDIQPKDGGPRNLPKPILATVRKKLSSDYPDTFPLSKTAYDGGKNIYSAVELPTQVFTVEISSGKNGKARSYVCTIKFVDILKFSNCNSGTIPSNLLQGMDLVMKQNPSMKMHSAGRCYYSSQTIQEDDTTEEDDLGLGTKACIGIQHSLKPTHQGLVLCLDYSILVLLRPMEVTKFLEQRVYNFNIREFECCRQEVVKTLKGLKVTLEHLSAEQKFTISGLSVKNTEDIEFDVHDPNDKDSVKKIKLVEYFWSKYRKDITYKKIPCLDLGKSNRISYVPMEFCRLAQGQRFPKENLQLKDLGKFMRKSSSSPIERRQKICNMVKSEDGPCGGDIIKNFGITVNMEMTTVTGYIIKPPIVKLRRQENYEYIKVDNKKCDWNFHQKSVAQGKSIQKWAVVDFTSDRQYEAIDSLIKQLMNHCNNLGINIRQVPDKLNWDKIRNIGSLRRVLRNVNSLTQVLQNVGSLTRVLENMKEENYEFLICVVSKKDPGYKNLKWVSETKVGIMTQCCSLGHNLSYSYYVNLALKINAKLGGSNVEVNDLCPCLKSESHVMFIGADVNHPGSGNTTSPSISAVVASLNWPAASQYAARVCPQTHRMEKILKFGNMCQDLVEKYASLNKAKPEKIVVFRDGVSDGQFDMVLNEELKDLKYCIETANYSPKITLVVAQKRHQTRFFQHGQPNTHSSQICNVSPGTVVDKDIVNKNLGDRDWINFYLCSHYGTLGTSKPTHYYVLEDENGFTSKQLHELIYKICFTYARCTKPVSLVTPVYYADLVAYRGQLYHEASMGGRQHSASAIGSTSSEQTSYDAKSFTLHADLENSMFFV